MTALVARFDLSSNTRRDEEAWARDSAAEMRALARSRAISNPANDLSGTVRR
jgi:hypothetical protein